MVTVETAERLMTSSRPRGGLWRGPTFILLGLSILLGALAADSTVLPQHGALSWLLPQIILLAVAGTLVYSIRKQRDALRTIQESMEAVQLRQWPRAMRALDHLLGRPVTHPGIRTESLLALAAVAEANEAYDASQRIYEGVLQEHQADPVQLHAARVGLGGAMLRTGQTTDAVSLIERMEREELPDSLRAPRELLALYREICLGHAADRLERAEERRALFRRHLGTQAGYGYALLAAAFDAGGQAEAARRHWHDATLLIPVAELVRRFPELGPLAGKHPPAEVPANLMPTYAPPVSERGDAEMGR